MSKKRVLNKSFESLFDDNNYNENESIQNLRLSEIEPNKNQPRKNFDSAALRVLADSIRENGVLQPLLVRPLPTGRYQIVAGERRWRASKMAGLDSVPVMIKELTEIETMQLALIENLQRENLNPLEEAMGYKELMDNFGMTQEELSKVVGKARSSITNSLRLLTLPKMVQELLENGEVSAGHCKALMGIKSPSMMVELALRAADGELSVRSIEKIVQRGEKKAEKKEEKPKNNFFSEVEISLTQALGTRVVIVPGKKKNTLEIEFYDEEQLSEIANKMSN